MCTVVTMSHSTSGRRASPGGTDHTNPHFSFNLGSLEPQLDCHQWSRISNASRSDAIVRSLEADLSADLTSHQAIGSHDDGFGLCVSVIALVLSVIALVSSGSLLCQTMQSLAIESTQTMMQP